ncbi:MAG: TetR/AcrR family transcriptional regulator; helix-turn-helix transcriptional regulator [Tannerella sp.]|nr:TetR/AcrR family transcriptional regulator; helix-turn-helix transcriptional regulator [Tannerella sp.]
MMYLKNYITETAVELFVRNGIKRVSMDDIARKANVSKRTLYGIFRDKEDLLVEAVKKSREPFQGLLATLEKSTETTLDLILRFNEAIIANQPAPCADYFEDIKRFPEAYNLFLDGKRQFLNKLMELLRRGVSEGVFIENINYDLISFIAHNHLSADMPKEMLTRYSHEEVHNTFFFTFLRGICTDKGRDILEKYYVKKNYKSYVRREAG